MRRGGHSFMQYNSEHNELITPVLICGGSGTRLWPLSRQSYPKQFTPLMSEDSLFQMSAKRLSGKPYAPPVVVTNSAFRFIVTEQLAAIGLEPGAILIEPDGRNTAPAILAAALHCHRLAPGSLLLVAPTDHVIPDNPAFQSAVSAGLNNARKGDIVTFGITPTRPETGYGYLSLSEPTTEGCIPVARFVEKPEVELAARMIAHQQCLWNSGIFLFSSQTIVDAMQTHVPLLSAKVAEAMKQASTDLGFLRIASRPWSEIEGISIDHAVMEKADNIYAVPFSGEWSDLGGWNAVWAESAPDANGVSTHGKAIAIDSKDTLLRSESGSQIIVGIGLNDVIAIAMPDAVLVADKSRDQDVKNAVQHLRDADISQADAFPRDHRPWGYFESLAVGARFQVKKIVVNPGGTLSLQSHRYRAEHWVVVEGTAKVTIDHSTQQVNENQSVYIPLGSVHRLENPTKSPLVLIEVQTGSYFGEDDITRYDDAYARGEKE